MADTGEGMSKAVMARIFNPFYTTRGPRDGTGLGLSIVWSLVREHGGNVDVESVPGVGSTFRVTLPVCASEAPRHEPALVFPPQVEELF